MVDDVVCKLMDEPIHPATSESSPRYLQDGFHVAMVWFDSRIRVLVLMTYVPITSHLHFYLGHLCFCEIVPMCLSSGRYHFPPLSKQQFDLVDNGQVHVWWLGYIHDWLDCLKNLGSSCHSLDLGADILLPGATNVPQTKKDRRVCLQRSLNIVVLTTVSSKSDNIKCKVMK